VTHSPATETVRVTFTVNGKHYDLQAPARTTVADLLRDHLGLTGTHLGCEQGACGACNVLLDRVSVRSCLLYAGQVEGQTIETVEHLASPDGELHPLQQAFHEEFGLQCGFCTPGLLISALELLRENAEPSEAEIRDSLSGNICRCTGYDTVVRSVQRAARSWRADVPQIQSDQTP
jgi:carbon-monoxide dehydrogenase small subunit